MKIPTLTPARVTIWLVAAAVSGLMVRSGHADDLAAGPRQQTKSASSLTTLAAPSPASKQPWHPWLKPHPQKNLPPLVLPKFQLTRSKAEVRELYKFAAEHPEVLNYVPCYCGCQRDGHHSNEDCFVKSRAKDGDVTAWTDHAMMCPMCLAIAERAMRMSDAGSSIQAIRASVKKTFDHTGDRTPTPAPPGKNGGR
ncbi:MAG TPA: PCYCGC motif-containing (lipo)protein [Vicinamibacterales bacterium]|nr:PCYCGC motif-containing (lipo)protein [Vicinamibacterales bacterium]